MGSMLFRGGVAGEFFDPRPQPVILCLVVLFELNRGRVCVSVVFKSLLYF